VETQKVLQNSVRVCMHGCGHVLAHVYGALVPPYFSILSHKRHNCMKNATKHNMSILIFSITVFETLLILRGIQRDTVINVKSHHVKYPLLLSDFN
jgi:hypothetical protein